MGHQQVYFVILSAVPHRSTPMDSPNPRKHSAHPLLRQAKQVKINNDTSYHITSDLCVDAFVMNGEMEWSKYSKYICITAWV